MQCPYCGRVIYSRQHPLCGYCGRELPLQYLLTRRELANLKTEMEAIDARRAAAKEQEEKEAEEQRRRSNSNGFMPPFNTHF